MEKKKLHKLDLILLVGISIIGIIGGMADVFYWKDYKGSGGAPVFTCLSVFISYALWIVLLIYSFLKYNKKEDKPKYVRWYGYFIVPFIHMLFGIIGLLIPLFIINILGL